MCSNDDVTLIYVKILKCKYIKRLKRILDYIVLNLILTVSRGAYMCHSEGNNIAQRDGGGDVAVVRGKTS